MVRLLWVPVRLEWDDYDLIIGIRIDSGDQPNSYESYFPKEDKNGLGGERKREPA